MAVSYIKPIGYFMNGVSDGDTPDAPMGMPQSRSAFFASGSQNARNPQMSRPITPIGFRPTSVLSQVATSGIGYAAQDYNRRLMGVHDTANGSSPETFQKTTMLRYPFMNTRG